MEDPPKALRVFDILENIFSYLDCQSLISICETCQLWKSVVKQSSLWRKLAQRLATQCQSHKEVLIQKGLNKTFSRDETDEEYEYFQTLCSKFTNYRDNWANIIPKETFLECSPEDVKKNFNFSWEPWWWWQNQGGWIASFSIDGDKLLCGVIETLQVWNLATNTCLAILETPKEDIVQGVDIALNCLDIHDNLAISGSNEGVIRVWNVLTLTYCKRLDVSEYGAVNALKLFQSFIISGHDDGQIMIWKVKSPDNIHLLSEYHGSNIIWGLDINKYFLVSCSEDCQVRVYSTEDALKEQTDENRLLQGYILTLKHKAAVTCVSLLDNVVVCGSRDKTVNVWKVVGTTEVRLHRLLAVLTGHTEMVHYVTQDTERVYSSDDEGQLVVWDKRGAIIGEQKIIRRIDHGGRGAIDCIQIRGTKMFSSYDDFGKIAINDFW